MAVAICGDDELFDLAAWFHKHSDRHSIKSGGRFYFLILRQSKFHWVFNSCCSYEINEFNMLTTYFHLVVWMNNKLRYAICIDKALAIVIQIHLESCFGESHKFILNMWYQQINSYIFAEDEYYSYLCRHETDRSGSCYNP